MTDEPDEENKPSEPKEPRKYRPRIRFRPGYRPIGRPPKKRELISPKMLKLLREKLGPSPGPLEVLQMAMNWYLDKGDIDAASKLAKDLAAYKIPKPAPVDSEGRAVPMNLSALTDRQLDMLIGRLQESIARPVIDATAVTASNNYSTPRRSRPGTADGRDEDRDG